MEDSHISQSKALSYFKKLIGQNNHFLITLLIGLDGIEKGKIGLSEEFSTSWNPKNKENSVMRSRHFAIKATLSWIVDSIDAYLTLSNRIPKIIQDTQFISEMDGAGHSVSKKMDVFKNNINCLEVESALVLLGITWRNRLVHNFAENKLDDNTREVLSKNKDYIEDNYRGLNINQLLMSFDSSYKSIPKFKEITALISASITFVTDVDKKLMERIEVNTYFEEVITYYILNGTEMENTNTKHDALKTVKSIWTKPIKIKKKKLLNVFRQYGCEISIYHTIIEDLSSLSYKEALKRFNIED